MATESLIPKFLKKKIFMDRKKKENIYTYRKKLK